MMGTFKNDTNGFTAVEVILVLVIIGLLGVVGFMFVNGRDKNDKDTVMQAAGTSVQATSTKTAQSTTASKQGADFLAVSEFNIKVPQQPAGNTISYRIDANNSNMADFVTSEQKALGGDCGTFSFARYHVYQSADNSATSNDEVLQNKLQYASANNMVVKANNKSYYILSDMSGGDCTGTATAGQSVSQQEQTANQDLLNALKKLVSAS